MKRLILSALAAAALTGVLSPSSAQAQALFGTGTGQCEDTRNWGELHDVDDAWDSDAAGWDGFHGAGLMWYGEMNALDVAAYFDCYTTPPTQTGYDGLGGKVIPLGWGTLTAQSMNGPMRLASLNVGTGWTAAQLTFTGFSFSHNQVWTSTKTVVAGAPTLWSLYTPLIDYFTIGVQYQMPDPFNSAELQFEANQTREPYETYFITDVQYGVVPEPSTYALMGAGLLALGAVARRRKRTQG